MTNEPTFDYIMREYDGAELHHVELTLPQIETYFAVEFPYEIVARRRFSGKYARDEKPLYEGDIIKLGIEHRTHLTGLGVIVFEDSSFKVKWYDPTYITIRGEKPEHIFHNSHIVWEIIGNIYENPNLLQ